MEGIDDLARSICGSRHRAARRRRLGTRRGWTAAGWRDEPGSTTAVLVAPVGLKPEVGEILDVFYYTPPQLRELTVHDPKTIPEWDELFARPPTPAEQEVALRNREMTARLTWKPYMHNPRLAHFLPRVGNPTLIVWGREDRIVPVVCGQPRGPGVSHARPSL